MFCYRTVCKDEVGTGLVTGRVVVPLLTDLACAETEVAIARIPAGECFIVQGGPLEGKEFKRLSDTQGIPVNVSSSLELRAFFLAIKASIVCLPCMI